MKPDIYLMNNLFFFCFCWILPLFFSKITGIEKNQECESQRRKGDFSSNNQAYGKQNNFEHPSERRRGISRIPAKRKLDK